MQHTVLILHLAFFQGIKKMEKILKEHGVAVRTFRFVPEVPLQGLELLWVR